MNYSRDNRTGGNSGKKYAKKSFGGRGFGGGDSAKPSMHKAICSECDRECLVPFRPSGEKPVFCRDCFKSKGDTGPRESSGRESGKRESFRRDFDKPNFNKSSGKSSDTITSEQFKILNSKLDSILDVLNFAGFKKLLSPLKSRIID